MNRVWEDIRFWTTLMEFQVFPLKERKKKIPVMSLSSKWRLPWAGRSQSPAGMMGSHGGHTMGKCLPSASQQGARTPEESSIMLEDVSSLPADTFGLPLWVEEATVMTVCPRLTVKKAFAPGLNPAIFTKIATWMSSSVSSSQGETLGEKGKKRKKAMPE